MERKTNLKRVKNCSEDPRFLKLKLFQLIGCFLDPKLFIKILTTGAKGGILSKSDGDLDVGD